MTRTQKAALASIKSTFGTSDFMFNFRNEYAHGAAGDVVVSKKVFGALVASGAIVVRDLVIYSVA